MVCLSSTNTRKSGNLVAGYQSDPCIAGTLTYYLHLTIPFPQVVALLIVCWFSKKSKHSLNEFLAIKEMIQTIYSQNPFIAIKRSVHSFRWVSSAVSAVWFCFSNLWTLPTAWGAHGFRIPGLLRSCQHQREEKCATGARHARPGDSWSWLMMPWEFHGNQVVLPVVPCGTLWCQGKSRSAWD